MWKSIVYIRFTEIHCWIFEHLWSAPETDKLNQIYLDIIDAHTCMSADPQILRHLCLTRGGGIYTGPKFKCSKRTMYFLYDISTFNCLVVEVTYFHLSFEWCRSYIELDLWLRPETLIFAKYKKNVEKKLYQNNVSYDCLIFKTEKRQKRQQI